MPLAVRLRQIQEWSLILFAATFAIGQALGEIALVVGLLAWTGRCVLERKVPVVLKHPLAPFLLLWFIVALCSMVNSVDVLTSLKGLQKLLKYFGLYALVLDTTQSPVALQRVLRGAFIGMALILVDGYWQASFGRDLFYGNPPAYAFGTVRRITATFGHPADLAIYLVSLMPVVLALGLVAVRWVRVQWMVCVVCAIAMMLLAQTRGGFLGRMCALLFLSYWMRRWLPATLAVAAVVFQAMIVPPEVKAWAATMPDLLHRLTEPERLMYWQVAINMIRAHPFIGIGVNTFAKAYSIYRVTGDHFAQVGPYAHNQYLQMAAELGLIGLAIFLAFLGRLFLLIMPQLKAQDVSKHGVLSKGLAAGLIGYLVFGLLESSLFYGRGSLMFWLLVGLLTSVGTVHHDLRNDEQAAKAKRMSSQMATARHGLHARPA